MFQLLNWGDIHVYYIETQFFIVLWADGIDMKEVIRKMIKDLTRDMMDNLSIVVQCHLLDASQK